MDDEKILFNNDTSCLNENGVEEVMHIRAAEWFSLGYGTTMVGIRITRGDKTRQYLDVTKEHYDEHGLGEVVRRALEARKKAMEEKT